MSEPLWNRMKSEFDRQPITDFYANDEALRVHRELPGYRATRLQRADPLAEQFGVAELCVKDESDRFGIQAFKALGASYAIYRFLKNEWIEKFPAKSDEFQPETYLSLNLAKELGCYTFCAATDGNHGRAVAWTAKLLDMRAVIFMPSNTVDARKQHIIEQGAELRLIDGTFDDCVTSAATAASQPGWQAISDTAYSGYTRIPQWIMMGYSSLFREAVTQSDGPFDLLVLQAGVGGLAAAGIMTLLGSQPAEPPRFLIVEPDDSACFYRSASISDGDPHAATGRQESIMAGLNCGLPSLVAWPVIRNSADLFSAVPDIYAEMAMRKYDESGIISGESGAAGLAGLLALRENSDWDSLKEKLGLNADSRILLINTEGDTDPENYRFIMRSE